MSVASEIQEVSDGLLFWQAYSPEVKADLSSCAVEGSEGWVIVDPVPLSYEAWEEFSALVSRPYAIVLTSGNHARAAVEFRQRIGVPVMAHPDALADFDFSVDREVREGESIAADLKVIGIPGAGPGEIAIYSTRGSLHLGDALINAEPYGFTFLPDNYCQNAAEMRRSLQKLLPLEISILTFAHGLPLVTKAHSRFQQLLA